MGTEASAREPVAPADACRRPVLRGRSRLAAPDQAGLADILKAARRTKTDLGVTGALVLDDDWSAPVPAGPQALVEALRARIEADPRHDGVRRDEAAPAPRRHLGTWATALVAERREPNRPMVATTDGLARGAP